MKETITYKNSNFTLSLIFICIAIAVAVFFNNPTVINKRGEFIKNSNLPIEQITNRKNLNNIIENLQQKNKQLDQFVLDTKSEFNDLKGQINNLAQILMSKRESGELLLSNTNDLEPIAKVESVEEQAKVQLETDLQTLDDLLLSEKVNEDWSNSINLVIDEALSQPKMEGMELVDKHCGSTLCRIEFTFDKATVDFESIDEMLSLTANKGEGFTNINEETSNVIMYFAKEDYSLF